MQNEKETSLDMDSPTWVTVFGFSPSKASYILKQFSHYGEILDHKIGNGNWMHILLVDLIKS
jgi:nuclear pore complex protein Nup53